MAYKIIDENNLNLLANAIRNCGYSGRLDKFPEDYITAVQTLSGTTFEYGIAYTASNQKTSASKESDSISISNINVQSKTSANILDYNNLIRCSYVENTSDSYINTRYIPKANDKIIIDCSISEPYSSYGALFGCRNNSFTTQSYGLFTYFNGSNSFYYFRTGKEQYMTSTIRGRRLIITCQGVDFNIQDQISNDVLYTGTISGCTIEDCLNECLIFDLNKSTASTVVTRDNSICRAKLYSFKIYDESDNLVVNMFPAHDELGIYVGMYDDINHIFCESLSSNKLIAGPDI